MKREKLEQIIIEELVNEGLMDILKKPSRWLMTSDDEGTAALDKADASNVRSWNSRRKVEAVKNFKKFMSNQLMPEMQKAMNSAKSLSMSLSIFCY